MGELPNQKTRLIHLDELERLRGAAHLRESHRPALNAVFEYARGTQAPGVAYALLGPEGDLRAVQHSARPELHFEAPAAASVDRGTNQGANQGAGEDRSASVVLGRHSHVDAPLDASNLSLRHVMLTQHPARPHAIEVRDLRSAFGTRLIDGTRLLASEVETPALFDLGELYLVVATTPLPDTAATFEQWLERLFTPTVTTLQLLPSPVGLRLERFRRNDEYDAIDGAGKASRSSLLTSASIPIPVVLEEMIDLTPSPEQITRGFIIGRYSRCDWPARADGQPSGLSRVHAMVFASHGAPCIVDTGSTNGLRHTALGPVRMKHLVVGDQFWLGRGTRLTVIEAKPTPGFLDA